MRGKILKKIIHLRMYVYLPFKKVVYLFYAWLEIWNLLAADGIVKIIPFMTNSALDTLQKK